MDVSCNRFTLDGAIVIAKGLDMNETLHVLKIGQNSMGSAGVMAVLKGCHNERNIIKELSFEVYVFCLYTFIFVMYTL